MSNDKSVGCGCLFLSAWVLWVLVSILALWGGAIHFIRKFW